MKRLWLQFVPAGLATFLTTFVSFVLLATLALSISCGSGQPTLSPTSLIPVPSAPQSNAISAGDASKFIGQQKAVQGLIVDSQYAAGSRGKPTFLNFEKPYPNHLFTAVIWGSDRSKFPPSPENYYRNKRVQVSGLIESYKGKPQIILRNESQIQIIN